MNNVISHGIDSDTRRGSHELEIAPYVSTNKEPETKSVSVMNDAMQQLFRRRMAMGGGFGGEVNTNPLNRDYASQFGYPQMISKFDYQDMYDRNPIAHRVVQLYPLECWQTRPTILDSNAPADSDFKREIDAVFSKHNIWGWLRRADILSGIGSYGILIIGINDGKPMNEPVTIEDGVKYELGYLRAFPESQVDIVESEIRRNSQRYGHPTMYRIQAQSPNVEFSGGHVDLSTQEIHWTRVVHIADNREISEIIGVPRLKLVYNACLDLMKIFGSSGEMFYKGAYPGYIIQATDNLLNTVQLDIPEIQRQVELFENQFQRWMALKNATVNQLSSSYADPTGHVEVCINQIAIGLGCPARILMGSERGELASTQDAVIWKKRLMERQESYLTPFLIKPVVQRLVTFGIVPNPFNNDFSVEWPDLSIDTRTEIYEVRAKQIEFLEKFYASNLDRFYDPVTFLMEFCDMSETKARTITRRAEQNKSEAAEKEAASLAPNMSGGASTGGLSDMGF